VVVRQQVESDPAEIERLITVPMPAVSNCGSDRGLFRQDLLIEVVLALFGRALAAALNLTERGLLGLEEASVAAASVFLDGARAMTLPPNGRPDVGSAVLYSGGLICTRSAW
jgi:hypothetical protein